jgi:hypothetical protein
MSALHASMRHFRLGVRGRFLLTKRSRAGQLDGAQL